MPRLDDDSPKFREAFRMLDYSPRDITRILGLSADTLRQRRHAEPAYFGAFGEPNGSDRWRYTAVDLVGIWLTGYFLERGDSLREASAKALDAANIVTAALANPDLAAKLAGVALIRLQRRDPVDPVRFNSFQAETEQQVADLRNHARDGTLILLVLPHLIELAPARLKSEIRNAADEVEE
jgi:hypothetical protein